MTTRKRIYLINDATGGYAYANDERMAEVLCQVGGYRQCTRDEYNRVYRLTLACSRPSHNAENEAGNKSGG